MTLDEIIGDAKSIAIGGHVRPDGDCVGSTLGVYLYIRTYYPEVTAQVYLEDVPEIFSFLDGYDEIRAIGDEAPVYDLFLCLDCGDAGRLGPKAECFHKAGRTACIDHHLSNEDFADVNYVYPKASSTCELVCELVDMEKVTKEMAECLYIGIVHDTGVFQYSCTHASTMNVAGQLMDKGIDYSAIIDRTFYEMTFAQNQLLGYSLSKAKLYENGTVIACFLTREEMARFGATGKDTDSVVNQLRVTRGVKLAIFLYQNPDGSYKGSLRTNDEINLVDLAKLYGGGGHAKAAGFTANQDPETEVIPRLIDAARLQGL